ncbi:UNVERIFIED_CONTAM: hypothetical protein FKN15_064163 [Acipenser sinensis]
MPRYLASRLISTSGPAVSNYTDLSPDIGFLQDSRFYKKTAFLHQTICAIPSGLELQPQLLRKHSCSCQSSVVFQCI